MIFSLGKSEPAAFSEVVALSGCSVVIIEVVATNGQRQNPCSSYSLVVIHRERAYRDSGLTEGNTPRLRRTGVRTGFAAWPSRSGANRPCDAASGTL